ncbi:MAG: hypothetical protein ABEJ72_01690, partial [Candidatus Aenigmatarchaeota archaeon]
MDAEQDKKAPSLTHKSDRDWIARGRDGENLDGASGRPFEDKNGLYWLDYFDDVDSLDELSSEEIEHRWEELEHELESLYHHRLCEYLTANSDENIAD